MAEGVGAIRRREDRGTWYIDLRPFGRIYGRGTIPFRTRRDAERVLREIQGKLETRTLPEVLAAYLPTHAKPNLVPERLGPWLEVVRRQVDAGDRSPTYLRELRRYARADGEFSWWDTRSIYEIDYAALEDWCGWLADRGLSAKTRKNVLGAFRTFLGWLRRRGEIRDLPECPSLDVPEYEPRVLRVEDQAAVLAAIPDARRGAFLAMALMGIRPGEARALDITDYRDGWLHISRAMKGTGPNSPIGPTKTKKPKRLPVPEELSDWIAAHVEPASRLSRAPLFPNPRTGRRWSHWALRDTWLSACERVGVAIPLYEGTKHTFATDAVARGVSERALQAFLGHADARSTRRYARLAETDLVAVLRRPDLSPACPQAKFEVRKPLKSLRNRASPTGFEPVLPP